VDRTFHFQIGCWFRIGGLEGNLSSHIQLTVIKNQNMLLPIFNDFTVLNRVREKTERPLFTQMGSPASHQEISSFFFLT
jgi:hypothetical protein